MRFPRSLYLLLSLAACQSTTTADYANPGDAERQLVYNTQTTAIELTNRDSLDRLRETLAMDTPSGAQLTCVDQDPLCPAAQSALLKAHIPLEVKAPSESEQDTDKTTEKAESTVMLTYKRLAVRGCENRYIDNSINSANIAQASLGCSIRSNMVQMVTDKQQFVNPALLDYSDGEKAAQNYQTYINPPAASSTSNGGNTSSLIGASSTSQ